MSSVSPRTPNEKSPSHQFSSYPALSFGPVAQHAHVTLAAVMYAQYVFPLGHVIDFMFANDPLTLPVKGCTARLLATTALPSAFVTATFAPLPP